MLRLSVTVASRCAKVVAGDGSVYDLAEAGYHARMGWEHRRFEPVDLRLLGQGDQEVAVNWLRSLLAAGCTAKGQLPEGYFDDKTNMRKFLQDFAAKKGFDYLDFTNWQKVRKLDLLEVAVCFLLLYC